MGAFFLCYLGGQGKGRLRPDLGSGVRYDGKSYRVIVEAHPGDLLQGAQGRGQLWEEGLEIEWEREHTALLAMQLTLERSDILELRLEPHLWTLWRDTMSLFLPVRQLSRRRIPIGKIRKRSL